MRKVIAMGETIMDIIFRGTQPVAATPGGSSFNSIVSIGRAGIPAVFVGETGRDEVGRLIAEFLNANHVDAGYLRMRDDIQSAVSLAFLDERNDARYMFYKQPPRTPDGFTHPAVESGDVVQFGSYYALNPYIRPQVKSFLEYARDRDAILYYDLNYRRTYKGRIRELLPSIHENFRLADIVRGSADDFEVMYDLRDADEIYRLHIAPHCPLFICTCGAESVVLCTPEGSSRFPVPPVRTVSTIGAGDNFNAGFIYGLIRYGIRRADLPCLSVARWRQAVGCGIRFAAEACADMHNTIGEEFGKEMAKALQASTRQDARE